MMRVRLDQGISLMAGFFFSLIISLLSQSIVSAEEVADDSRSVRFEDFLLMLPEGLEARKFYWPANNPPNKEKVALGRALFFDVRLSVDNTVSCSSCHSPQFAFADGRSVSLGVGAQAGRRNAPTIINRAFSQGQFWDGRADSLEEQSKGPLINPVEMGMPSHGDVIEKLGNIEGYRKWFRRVFAREVNIDDLARAIAAFERTVVSGLSKFDAFKAGDHAALSKAEQRGLDLFEGKARCSQCHSGFNFTDEKFHNLGVDWDTPGIDLGRYRFTKQEMDIGAFKTPTLREIAHTAPYMHNGKFATLEEVVAFYNQGGVANPFLDVEMRRTVLTLEQTLDFYDKEKHAGNGRINREPSGLNLTRQEQADLVAFLKALSGEGWQQITAPESFPQ